eukprot:6201118-Pleurochrysis_carterae.AAC.1
MVGGENFSLARPYGGNAIVRARRSRVVATRHVSSYHGSSTSGVFSLRIVIGATDPRIHLTSIYISNRPTPHGDGFVETRPTGRRLLVRLPAQASSLPLETPYISS